MNEHVQSLPSFIVIGAGKSGTTSLDQYFNQHPEIFMARKEPCFFAIKNEPDDQEILKSYPNGVTNLNDYIDLFKKARPGQIKGEVSPIYLNSDIAPLEIKKAIPNVKLIAILRHPADRLYSRYLHLAGEFTAPDLNTLFDKKSDWHWRKDLIKEGYYARNLKPYLELFQESQIKIILFDEFKNNPVKVMTDLYEFVGVSPDFSPDMTIQYNQSGKVSNKFVHRLVGRGGLVNTMLKKASSRLYYSLKSNQTVYKMILDIRNRNMIRPPMSKELKRQITDEFYADDLKELEEILIKDLSAWRQV